MTEQRPALALSLTGEELRRWYWLKDELLAFARSIGVGTRGGKQELTDRLAAVLDGRPLPPAAPVRRVVGALLPEPVTEDTVIRAGQRCSQQLRDFFQAEIGPAFRFDAAMRSFIADGAGRTLGDAVRHWHATRGQGPQDIGPQFELNRFLRDWNAAHPGAGRNAALAAWRDHRSRPVDDRPGFEGRGE
ncbi:DUF6434 domain-containing protein [Streptomyces europaeiscabiei]|uniref:DUF6434 domain-containing protein n=1 Tax=Streptomyces europaeiscabiei TaxID=146819 RepID=UPI002E14AC1C|nr:DUF6434 domain-containing protein [Streptomyces europaeiscabiei]